MRHKFVYSCSVKICASGFDKFLESIFLPPAFSLQKVIKMLEEVVVGWQEVRWIWWMRQNLVAKFTQLLKCWLCEVWSGPVVEKNWAHAADRCGLWSLQCSMHLNNLLSILLSCNDFTRIPKTVVDQTNSRPPNSDQDLLLVQVWFWEVLWSVSAQPLSWSSLVVIYYPLYIAHHNLIEKWCIIIND